MDGADNRVLTRIAEALERIADLIERECEACEKDRQEANDMIIDLGKAFKPDWEQDDDEEEGYGRDY